MNCNYEIGIVGGGLAGLTAAIQYAKAGYKVILFEKNKFPFHRVCGEYISNESWDFLNSLGLNLEVLNLPKIDNLLLTSVDGIELRGKLDLGGFGISRYTLDEMLKNKAISLGVEILVNTKVKDILCTNDTFEISTNEEIHKVKLAIGSFGKRSNLDVKWQRNFIIKKESKLTNYVGVKYHIKHKFPDDLIALHNFENGYCGISKIEKDRYCLCYLATAKGVNEFKDLKEFEQNVLHKNTYLEEIFTNATFLFDKPIVISQISFDSKSTSTNNIGLLGDACGMIVPLCGNGMSMAMHSSKLFFNCSLLYLNKKITYNDFLQNYATTWNTHFKKRLQKGRWIQSIFQSKLLTKIIFNVLKNSHWLLKKIISQTHGMPF
jgi:flavin-dependent dehydrogenase